MSSRPLVTTSRRLSSVRLPIDLVDEARRRGAPTLPEGLAIFAVFHRDNGALYSLSLTRHGTPLHDALDGAAAEAVCDLVNFMECVAHRNGDIVWSPAAQAYNQAWRRLLPAGALLNATL